MKTILLTGASGRIGSCLRAAFRNDYHLILFNRSKISDLGVNERYICGDTADFEALAKAADGADTIVDMAAAIGGQSFREKLLPTNILGTYNVFEVARTTGIRRVIYGSTHHVVGCYPAGLCLDEKAPVRPDSMYAVTKCFAEAMGRLYSEKAGLQVVCIRIGVFREQPLEERHLALWISPRDMVRLIRCALEVPKIQFEIVNGISKNDRNWLDLTYAHKVLGYAPEDNAEIYAKELLNAPPSAWLERIRFHGGDMRNVPFIP